MSLLDRLAASLRGTRKPKMQYVKTPERPVIIRPEKVEDVRTVLTPDRDEENLKEELDRTMAEMNEMINELQGRLEETIKKSGDECSEELQNKIDEELNALRNDIGKSFSSLEDKIHSENVKTYRNIQALINEVDKKSAKDDVITARFAGVRRLLGITTWVTIGTFIVLAVYVLHSMGVF
ncbi:MAG: hypothetical protein II147_07490 [Lachnospiraceae bacterium]|jgi:ElaB/YqjD/DUF883 family membrane-anchored ribosome-binding protein|nr:hypothetical protein [Lachnospiraceae bacterium]